MKIKYADGTCRECGNEQDVRNCLAIELPDGFVTYAGLVWRTEEESENDDGQRAVAEILDDTGNRADDFEI